MTTHRLEAFSDGVIAIIITIMVLELEAPEEASFDALKPMLSVFSSYVVSFVYLGIYWSNHHHLFHVSEKINGNVMWANLHLLFWLSLIPFSTAWMGENHFGAAPMAIYGFVLLMSAFAFSVLQSVIIKAHKTALKRKRRTMLKIMISISLYIIGIILSFYNHIISMLCYIAVALIWLIPDYQIEKQQVRTNTL